MGATLVTGATGHIGLQVARLAAQRGDDVRVLVRESSSAEVLDGIVHRVARGDILDRRSVRRALRGVDRVFHCAGLTSLRAQRDQLERVNVAGTRLLLEECLRANVQRVVLSSSVAAVGPSPKGSTADETQIFSDAFGVPYVSTKREAEVQALRVAARGLDLVIVCPSFVFGVVEGMRGGVGLVRRFLQRRIPAYVDGAINVVDVADAARGHLLADEHGTAGERYILGNRNYTLDRLFADLGRLSGVQPPALKLPLEAALAFARAAELAPGRPSITRVEVRATALWWTYRSTKARRELGWTTGPHEETVERTIAWYRARELPGLAPPGAKQPAPYRLAGFGARRVAGFLDNFAP